MQIVTGVALLVLSFVLFWIGMPDKSGESPRFLRFEHSLALYPPLILVLFALGIAAILSAAF